MTPNAIIFVYIRSRGGIGGEERATLIHRRRVMAAQYNYNSTTRAKADECGVAIQAFVQPPSAASDALECSTHIGGKSKSILKMW